MGLLIVIPNEGFKFKFKFKFRFKSCLRQIRPKADTRWRVREGATGMGLLILIQ